MSFFDEADLDQQAEADKEAADSPKFDPAPGDSVNAVLTKAELFIGDGRYAPTIVINFRNVGDKTVGGVEPGKVAYMFLPTVLRRKMIAAAPAVGSAFKLRYEGLTTPEKGGNPYKDYTLITESMQDGADPSKSAPQLWTSLSSGLEDNRGHGDRGFASGSERTSEGEWKF